jgi:hypothetical protein
VRRPVRGRGEGREGPGRTEPSDSRGDVVWEGEFPGPHRGPHGLLSRVASVTDDTIPLCKKVPRKRRKPRFRAASVVPDYPQRDSKQPVNRHFVSICDRTGTAPRCMYRAYHSFAVLATMTGLPGGSGQVREETVKGVGRSAAYYSSRLERRRMSAAVPITIRGDRLGVSQRSNFTRIGCGSATQPLVG